MNHTRAIFFVLAALTVSSPTFAAGANNHFEFPDNKEAIKAWFTRARVDADVLDTVAAELAGQRIQRPMLSATVSRIVNQYKQDKLPNKREHRASGARQSIHGSIPTIVDILSRNGAPQPPQAAHVPAARKNTGRQKR